MFPEGVLIFDVVSINPHQHMGSARLLGQIHLLVHKIGLKMANGSGHEGPAVLLPGFALIW